MKYVACIICVLGIAALQAEESAAIVQLRADLAAAAKGATVVVPSGVHKLESPLQLPAKSISLKGATDDPRDVVLNGNGACRVIVMGGSDYAYALTGLTISNGFHNVANGSKEKLNNGAGVGGLGSVYATNCVFTCCYNEKANGGAIRGDRVTLSGCVLEGNVSAQSGGVLCGDTAGGSIGFYDSVFTGNVASNYGGCVSLDAAVVLQVVSNCAFAANTAGAAGGVLSGNVMSVRECAFTNNTGTMGGVWNSGNSVRVATYFVGCDFVGNKSVDGAGAALLEQGMASDTYPSAGLRIDDCRFIGNESRAQYGCVSLTGPAWYVSNTLFACNISTNQNEGLTLSSMQGAGLRGCVGDMYNCVFSNNLSRQGGAAWHDAGIATNKWFGERGKVEKCVFVGNEVRGNVTYKSGAVTKNPPAPGAVMLGTSGKVPLFKDCDFLRNVATNCTTSSGNATVLGVALRNTGDVRLENCRFIGNCGQASAHGTFNGRSMAGIVGCTFADNVMAGGYSGAGVLIDLVDGVFSNSLSRIENCTFTRNSPGAVGLSYGWAQVTDSTFTSNSNAPAFCPRVWGYSGGADNTRRADSTYNRRYWIDRCRFLDNVAENGPALASVDSTYNYSSGGKTNLENDYRGIVRNSLFAGNRATSTFGGAIHVYDHAELAAENCTFVDNQTQSYYKNADNYSKGGAIYVRANTAVVAATNCLFYMNRAYMENASASGQQVNPWKYANIFAYDLSLFANCFVANDPDYPQVDYRTLDAAVHLQDGVNGNIVQDEGPQFVDRAGGDYHLAKNSACVNAGANAPWMNGATDLDNNPKRGRIAQNVVDIGCYEFWPNLGLLLLLR